MRRGIALIITALSLIALLPTTAMAQEDALPSPRGQPQPYKVVPEGVVVIIESAEGEQEMAPERIYSEVYDAQDSPSLPAPTPVPQEDVHKANDKTFERSKGKGRNPHGVATGDEFPGNITHYCVCMKCCGKVNGVTASGLKIQNGMEDPFIAACNWLPFGTVVSVDGVEYTVMDRGGSGLNDKGRLDLYVPDGHQEALRRGRKRNVPLVIVYLPEKK